MNLLWIKSLNFWDVTPCRVIGNTRRITASLVTPGVWKRSEISFTASTCLWALSPLPFRKMMFLATIAKIILEEQNSYLLVLLVSPVPVLFLSFLLHEYSSSVISLSLFCVPSFCFGKIPELSICMTRRISKQLGESNFDSASQSHK